MRAFLFAVIAAMIVAAGAAIILNSYVPDAASRVFSTEGVRI